MLILRQHPTIVVSSCVALFLTKQRIIIIDKGEQSFYMTSANLFFFMVPSFDLIKMSKNLCWGFSY